MKNKLAQVGIWACTLTTIGCGLAVIGGNYNYIVPGMFAYFGVQHFGSYLITH